MQSYYNDTSYLNVVYDTKKFHKTIRKIVKIIKDNGLQFDAIAFRGNSGSAAAYPLSYLLNKPLICIRKDSSHHGKKYEGAVGVQTYIIVDDFVESGTTIKEIRNIIKDRHDRSDFSNPECVAIILYDDLRDDLSDKTPKIIERNFGIATKLYRF